MSRFANIEHSHTHTSRQASCVVRLLHRRSPSWRLRLQSACPFVRLFAPFVRSFVTSFVRFFVRVVCRWHRKTFLGGKYIKHRYSVESYLILRFDLRPCGAAPSARLRQRSCFQCLCLFVCVCTCVSCRLIAPLFPHLTLSTTTTTTQTDAGSLIVRSFRILVHRQRIWDYCSEFHSSIK